MSSTSQNEFNDIIAKEMKKWFEIGSINKIRRQDALDRPVEMKKFWGGGGGGRLGFCKNFLTNFVSWLGRWFNWNRLKCQEILCNANSQHDQLFVKYLSRVSSQSLQKFQVTVCRFEV